MKRKYIDTYCKDCGEHKKRRSYQLKVWKGRCRSCAQKIELSRPERIIKQSNSAREQLLKQGGIPNAKHFTSERVKGEKNCKWKGGGITSIEKLERGKPEVIEWRKAVMKRDNYTCQICKQIGYNLHAHHKKAWSEYPELRHDLDNGITLCENCHLNIAHQGAYRNSQIDLQLSITGS